MEISFNTKEESNIRREQTFLELTPSERVRLFILRSIQLSTIPSKIQKNADKDNFVIKLYKDE